MPALTEQQWEELGKHYRLGIRSNLDLSKEFKVGESAIRKQAAKRGWTKDLSAKIQAKADELVQKKIADEKVRVGGGANKGANRREGELIVANATLQASIRSEQMKGATANREMVEEQIEALRLEISCKKEFGELADLMKSDDPDMDKAAATFNKVLSFGSCVDNLKKLMELWIKLAEIERKVYGLDRVDETGRGEWTVILSADEANL